MNLTRKEANELEMTLYSCYVDGGDPLALAAHAFFRLGITVEQKPVTLGCNWEAHVPGGRVYLRETAVPP